MAKRNQKTFPKISDRDLQRSWQPMRLSPSMQLLSVALKRLGRTTATQEFLSACGGTMNGAEQQLFGERANIVAWRLHIAGQGYALVMVEKLKFGGFDTSVRKFGSVRRCDARAAVAELVRLVSKTMQLAA